MIDSGANIEARNKHGLTPLSVAAVSGFPDTANFLVKRGADLSIVVETFETIVYRNITG